MTRRAPARHVVADGPGQAQNDTPETHAFWREFAAHVRDTKPEALLVGENWTTTDNIAPYYGSTAVLAGGNELPMNFNFPLSEAIIKAVREGDASPIVETFEAATTAYPGGVLDGTFLTNHDMPRVATQLNGNPDGLRLAASLLFTLPGTPFLYYGEEIGMVGDKPDPDIRTPMQWSAEIHAGFSTAEPWKAPNPDFRITNVADQTADPTSLLSLYRRLTHLRNETPALRHGGIEFLSSDTGSTGILAFLRAVDGQRVLVAHNLAEEAITAGPLQVAATGGEVLFASSDDTAVRFEGGVTLTLPPSTGVVVRLEESGPP